MQRDSISNTFVVATALCVVCSVLVSTAAVGLRPAQSNNRLREKKRNILEAAGLYQPGADIDRLYERHVDPQVIDLATGKPVEPAVVDPGRFDQMLAAKDPNASVPIAPEKDLAGIGRREKCSFVYRIRGDDGELQKIVLPVYGKGLWSTMYGFLALDLDLRTIRGLTFYQHGETPGLGGEVDNPQWKSLWDGKLAFADDGTVQITVIRGNVDPGDPSFASKVDGLAGATITSRGVSNLLHYWLGPDGFGPYLSRLKTPSQ
jgi:Na+-transporting NADH:ubiquinone oxidoreductase subunit C